MKLHNSTYRLVLTALFVALVILFGLTPVGLISLGFINVTLLCIPVIAGTLILGLKTGLLLGACFGLVSFLSMLGVSLTPPSSLAATLFSANGFLAALMCFVPRLAVPAVAWGVYKLAAKKEERSRRALPFAAAAGSIANTILYLGMMLLFYVICGLDASAILGLIAGTGAIAGVSEAVVAALIVTPVVTAIWKIQK